MANNKRKNCFEESYSSKKIKYIDIIVIKRDKTEQIYEEDKIKNVMKIAFDNTGVRSKDILQKLTDNVTEIIHMFKNDENKISIEVIQDIVEKVLMKYNYFSTAKHFILYRNNRNDYRQKYGFTIKNRGKYEIPWGEIGYIVYKRTYSRIKEDNNSEEFDDTIMRILHACQNQLKVGFTKEELEMAYKYFITFKGSVAGRFMWQLGTNTVNKLGLASLQNCAGVVVDKLNAFLWSYDMLLLGSGVGFSIEKKYVSKLPVLLNKNILISRLDTNDADFIIPDKREGWIGILREIFNSYFNTGKSFTYSTILVRAFGKPIKSFGGTSSGPEPLCKGIEQICDILKNRKGDKLTSVDCLDIMCIISSVVVAGNTRRCIKINSLVHTENGLEKIQNIKVGDKVLTSTGYKNVLNTFKQGKQTLCKIITQDGEFECTPNHRMAVLNDIDNNHKPIYEWKEVQELKEGDVLMTSRIPIEGIITTLPKWDYVKSIHSTTCKDIKIPELTCDMAWFIGLFHGNGCAFSNYNKNGFNAYISLVFALDKLEIAEKAKQQLELFGNNLHITLNKRKNENSYEVHCQSKQLSWYFDKNIKQSKTIIKTPDFILKAKQDIKLAYISGVIDSDSSPLGRPVQLVSSIYIDWVKELQVLCYSCGIETRIDIQKEDTASRQNNNHNWQYIHKLNLITNHSKNLLNNNTQLIKKLRISSKPQYSNGFDIKLFNDIESKMKKKLGFYSAKQITIDTYEKEFSKLDFCPVKVKEILYEDIQDETYDIEVDDNHEFYCNGYLTHNSALLSLGDYDDIDYLKAKRWDLGNIPNWRAMCNLSVNCNDITTLPDLFWEGYKGNGECYGLVNMDLTKQIGRVVDGNKYPDPDVEIYNPCCEQPLFGGGHNIDGVDISHGGGESCCLSTLFLPNIDSFEELKSVATILYRICKHSLMLDCHQKTTGDIIKKNMRMGVSITGYYSASDKQKLWLSDLYEYLREYDIGYSKKLGVPVSIKLTTVQPSGTLSLLPRNITPGAHSGIFRFFIRRVRIASGNSLIQLCKDHGFKIEYQKNFDGTDDRGTTIVEFPCRFSDNTVLAKDLTACDQLENIKHLQTVWSDNAVSCTIYYKLEELEDIKTWLSKNYTKNIKSVSFMLHQNHNFKQAPYEEITEDQYNELKKNTKEIVGGNFILEMDESGECSKGHCPVR